MTQPTHRSALLEPPARRLRLLTLAPGAAVVFGLLTVWLAVTGVQNLRSLVARLAGAQGEQPALSLPVWTGLVVLGLVAPVVTGLVTYRLGVEVPRTLRGWNLALAERTQALRDR